MVNVKTPEDCLTKKDIRDEIDRLDEELVRLFAVRQGFVRRMSELKQHPDEAFDAERIESMIEIIRKRAEELGLEADQADMVWRTLIDWNIAFERRVIAARLERNSQAASITPD
ncbi:chorismate mutase [uncultured Roseibium sp.]|uniref:chorismate mutase n=1 Tax=uncultured Roseibium sp. TaxID=1936171 RepID=UPI0026121D01|nr:chorismate mutase [uncultured Roseibium sp.]